MFGMFQNMFREDEFLRKMGALQKKLKPAMYIKETKCLKCSYCCWQRPGSLDISDVENIAKFLKINAGELFKNYLVVDRIGGETEYCLLPRRKSQEDIVGKFVPTDRTFDIDTPCVFLDEDKKLCSIHEVKPQGCARMECWLKNGETVHVSQKHLEALGWDGDEYWYDEEDEW